MKITITYNDKFKCKWYHCTDGNHTYSSPHLSNVEVWRDDRIANADYHKEIADLHDKAMAYMYENNHNNWTGD
jgi:hypothetical protein